MLWKVSVNKKDKNDLSSVHLAASSRLAEHPQLCWPWSHVWEEGEMPPLPFPSRTSGLSWFLGRDAGGLVKSPGHFP